MNQVAIVDHQKNVPHILKAFLETETQIRQSGLSDTLYHLVKLRASQLNNCAYCVKMHTSEALKHGDTHERVERLIVWRHVNDFTPEERAALDWTEALTELDDRTGYADLRLELQKHYSDAQISALTALIAMINLWNRMGVSNH
ncbi:carboxymuconolactone decarboxylase family protein [Roseibium sp.]|uniref:carboxymuconolactone decarboxylase family protein n=1 Tax=Roseibium sp. TaxID=1936156 RepID=UPI003A98474E